MKQRPRRVEREIAKRITLLSEMAGADPVERLPVNGRTGPDIEINQLGLVIDVKSRGRIPAQMMISEPTLFIGDYYGFQLKDMSKLIEDIHFKTSAFFSLTVEDWFNHMDEWRLKNCPDGITTIILHRPKGPIGSAVIIIKDREKFILNWSELLKKQPSIFP